MAGINGRTKTVVRGRTSRIEAVRTGKTSVEANGKILSDRSPKDSGVRVMPESLAAEAAVLGSMIIDQECIGQVVEGLRADSFYRIEHRYIFDAIVALYEKHLPPQLSAKAEAGVAGRVGVIDAVLLRDELERRGQLEEVGGVEYLARIMDSVPSTANVMYYAGIVKDKSLLREIITAAGEIMDEAYDQSTETSEALDEAERKIFAITDKKITGKVSPLKDLITRAYELIDSREGKLITGLATGFYELDDLTCGLQNGEMIIVAGRPSMGKTSLALNMAEYMGVVEKIPVAIFSLEMGQQQLAERFLCSRGGLDSQKVRKGMLDTEHKAQLKNICGEIYEAPIYIDDTSTMTPLELRAKARRTKSLYNIRAIFVDYLQLMHMGTKVESRQQEITTISRYIKALARELNIPVVVMSQLNRAPEGREDHRPRMSDLRESGSIEQDADVVILLHREDYYHRGEKGEEYTPDNKAELIIAKQRNGPTGVTALVFREKFTRFENASFAEEPAVPF